MAYLLDTNVFIEAKNRYYGFDICPGFWDWLLVQNRAGRVFSISHIEDELRAGNDDLAAWAKARGSTFFLPPDPTMLASLPRLAAWATGQKYEPAAVNTFFQSADYYLVGHGLAHGHVIVTHEVPSTSVRKIKIPEPCIGLSIKFMTPFAMLRAERARFALKE